MFFKQGIYKINKPLGWTSHDVVNWIKYRADKQKVGHAGTLDPAAEGLLLVAVGRDFTRQMDTLMAQEKEYYFEITFGVRTDTYDGEGKVLNRIENFELTKDQLTEVLQRFLGEQEQLPPMYSAVKVQGKKLYELAREGKEVERTPKKINIKELELLEFSGKSARLRAVCSKGTYIRSLCYDIGEKLGIGAYMSALKRTRIGAYLLDNQAIVPVGSQK